MTILDGCTVCETRTQTSSNGFVTEENQNLEGQWSQCGREKYSKDTVEIQ